MLDALSRIGVFDSIAILSFVVLIIGSFNRHKAKILAICGPILLLWMTIYLISLIWHILWPFIWFIMLIIFWLSVTILLIMTSRYWIMIMLCLFIVLIAMMFFVSAIFMWPLILLAIFITVV